MAQYDVMYVCGHLGTVRLYGPQADRQRKIAYLEGVECPRCTMTHATPQIDVWLGPWHPLDGQRRHYTPPVARVVVDITDGYPIRELLKSRGYRFVREPADGRGLPLMLGLLSTIPPSPVGRKQWGWSDIAAGRRALRDIAMELIDLRRIADISRRDIHYQTHIGRQMQILLGRPPKTEA